jgi:hypothetical protein
MNYIRKSNHSSALYYHYLFQHAHARSTLSYKVQIQSRHVASRSARLSINLRRVGVITLPCVWNKSNSNTCPPRIALRIPTASTFVYASSYSFQAGFNLQKAICIPAIEQAGAVAHSTKLKNVASHWYVTLRYGATIPIADPSKYRKRKPHIHCTLPYGGAATDQRHY